MEPLARLVGNWTTEATHRAFPGVIVRGTAGEPRMTMHYFDSRGVFRLFEAAIDDRSWRVWRNAPGFSQRFTGTFSDGGKTITGVWQLCEDDVHWNDDLQITYRR